MRTQFPDIPGFASKDADPGVIATYRVNFPVDDFKQRRLAGTIGTENRGRLVLIDTEIQSFEDACIATVDRRVADIDEWRVSHLCDGIP